MTNVRTLRQIFLSIVVLMSYCYCGDMQQLVAAQPHKQVSKQKPLCTCKQCTFFKNVLSIGPDPFFETVSHCCEQPPCCCILHYAHFLVCLLISNTVAPVVDYKKDSDDVKKKIAERIDKIRKTDTLKNFIKCLQNIFHCKHLITAFIGHIEEVAQGFLKKSSTKKRDFV